MTRRVGKRAVEAPAREAFLDSLLNEDLQHLTKWHGSRPHHEQKRFLRSVDTLYKGFVQENPMHRSKASIQAEQNAQNEAKFAAMQAASAARARAAEEDPLNGPPRTPREQPQLGGSASAPSLPIEVFEQRKRDGRKFGEEGLPNSLADWLDAGSVTTATTGTTATSRFTSLTQKTKTSSGGPSICSEPGTMTQMHYRHHRRGLAVNRQDWEAPNQHEAGNMKDGIPNFGLPDAERMHTAYKEQFGHISAPSSSAIQKAMYADVFKDGSHEFLDKYVAAAPPEKQAQFMGMVRSLQYLRGARKQHGKSTDKQAYDLNENSRLWKPIPQKPWMGPSECNLSTVPLGTLTKHNPPVVPPTPPPPRMCPPSPSVSNLGSMPLSRMSTPAY